jgi:non-ribosomal peptide synthetase component F
LRLDPRGAQLDLTLMAGERADGSLGLALIHDDRLLEPGTAESWLRAFGALLDGAAARPAASVSELPLMAEAEMRQVLAEMEDGAELPWPNLHAGFATQAARTPEAVAVVAGAERTTYEELAHRAGALAAHLRKMGAGPEKVVGVRLERNADLIAALLGVLETGAAYLPLDPVYPEERISFMVEDAGAGWVVTSSERGRLGVNAAGTAGFQPAIDFISRQDAAVPAGVYRGGPSPLRPTRKTLPI